MLLQTREPDIVTGIGSISEDQNISFYIYPNPAREILNFSFSILPGIKGSIILLNLTGEVVMETDRLQSQLDISRLSDGIYIVQILQNHSIAASMRLILMK
ncbi:MAG TPA: T9SS type A sorting domain-containing protein [Cyclobacteriaceae bacterium]|nr:T9SS type A sorting domain-containing protein [Cyclobacteriaceae bacterium]